VNTCIGELLASYALISFSIQDARDSLDRLLQLIVDDDVLVLRHRLQFRQRTVEPALQARRVLRTPLLQPSQQRIAARRQDEDHDRLREGAPELRGPLHVDVHDHLLSLRQHARHFRAERAVPHAVHLRTLRELIGPAPRRELGGREEMIVAPIHFTRPRRARRRAHRVAHIRTAL
jgi:hypothetical protein